MDSEKHYTVREWLEYFGKLTEPKPQLLLMNERMRRKHIAWVQGVYAHLYGQFVAFEEAIDDEVEKRPIGERFMFYVKKIRTSEEDKAVVYDALSRYLDALAMRDIPDDLKDFIIVLAQARLSWEEWSAYLDDQDILQFSVVEAFLRCKTRLT